jgi:hypothetical protein
MVRQHEGRCKIDPELERRLRRPPPPDSCVVPDSTPVVGFGDFERAHVATLGLNPSKLEFLDGSGKLLTGAQARFETLLSIEQPNLAHAPVEALMRVVESCRRYFFKNPYRRWFNVLESFVVALGASYYNGTACHLDLAQWATYPTWGDLSDLAQRQLLADGKAFLSWQLEQRRIRILLLNGRGVVSVFSETMGVPFVTAHTIPGPVHRKAEVLVAKLPSGILAVGWSTNLQSSYGVSREFKTRLTEIVRELCDGVRKRAARG